MTLGSKFRLAVPLLVAIALGCAHQTPSSAPSNGSPAAKQAAYYTVEQPTASLGKAARMQRLASYRYQDWSSNSVHIPGLRQLRQSLQGRVAGGGDGTVRQLVGPASGKGYGTLSLDPKYSATNPLKALSGPPAKDGFGHTYWLTENGDIYLHNRNDTGAPSFLFHLTNGAASSPAPTTDTFPNTALTIYSTDGTAANTIGYAVSAQGNFYTIDFSANTVQVVAMGGAISGWGYGMPPAFFDNDYTTANTNTVYAVTTNGTLHKFIVNFHTKAVTSDLHISTTHHNRISGCTTTLEYNQSSPIVFGGKLSLGTVVRTLGCSAGLGGYFTGYDVGNWTASTPPTLIKNVLVPGCPFFVPPSIEIDTNNGDTTTWAFGAGGNHVFMIDYQGSGTTTSSPLLVVNPTDGNSGNPSGSTTYGSVDGIQNQPIVWDGDATDPFSVYVMNTNAVWKIDYSSATYGDDLGNHGGLNFAERAANFAATGTTWFCRTHLGRTHGSLDSSGYFIGNTSQLNSDPDGTSLYALDMNDAVYTGTAVSLNRLNAHPTSASTAPTLEEYHDLPSGLTNEIPTWGMDVDFDASPVQIQFGTTANRNTMAASPSPSASPLSAIWVYERN